MVFVSHLAYHGAIDAPTPVFNLRSGVLLFFALSGYLLYRPFVIGDVDLGAYAVRRAARIVPAYLVALVGVTALSGDLAFFREPARYLLFLQNFDLSSWQGFLGVSWTLVVEVWFYAFLPLVALVVRRRPTRLIALALLSFAGAELGMLAVGGPDPRLTSSFPPFMLWAFVPGMLVALTEDRLPVLGRPVTAVAGVALVLIGLRIGLWASVDFFTAAGSGLLVAWSVRRWTDVAARLMGGFAAISYSVYLWHIPLIEAYGLAAVPLTLALASAIYTFVERPVLRGAHQALAIRSSDRRAVEIVV